MQWSSYR